MTKSPATRLLKNKWIGCKAASYILTTIPVVIFEILNFIAAKERDYYKLTIILVIAVVLYFANFIIQFEVKYLIVLLLVLSCTIANPSILKTMLITLGSIAIIDEMVICPLANKYKEEFNVNKILDARGAVNAG